MGGKTDNAIFVETNENPQKMTVVIKPAIALLRLVMDNYIK